MKKILIICYKRPYPVLSGAEVRMYQFIEMLSKENVVDIAFISENANDEELVKNICNNAFVVSRNRVIDCFRIIYGYLFRGLPMQVAQTHYKKLKKVITSKYQEYDFIIASHIKTSRYLLDILEKDANDKLIFDATDSITLQSENAYIISKGWKKLAYYFEYKRMKKYEKYVFENIPKTLLISERDKKYIIEKLGAKCNPTIITNYAIDLGYKEDIEKVDFSMTFMGKMDYQPNVNAVLYFIENIYPQIKKIYPLASFHVIGANAPKAIEDCGGTKDIYIHGFVEDAAEYLQRSSIIVAPMRSGAGLQNKIVQAMYLECTVITSKIGADGLDNLNGDELIIYNNDNELVNNLIYYLDPQNRKEKDEIGKRARKFVQKHYGYDAVKSDIMSVLEKSTY